jgi:hypothetical protein
MAMPSSATNTTPAKINNRQRHIWAEPIHRRPDRERGDDAADRGERRSKCHGTRRIVQVGKNGRQPALKRVEFREVQPERQPNRAEGPSPLRSLAGVEPIQEHHQSAQDNDSPLNSPHASKVDEGRHVKRRLGDTHGFLPRSFFVSNAVDYPVADGCEFPEGTKGSAKN